jgi:hypothetical protein
MSISFEFENALSPESSIYPLIADLSGPVTLYLTEESNRYESRDFPISIDIKIKSGCHNVYVALISCYYELPNISNDVPYNDSVMKALLGIGELSYNSININSPNRYHPLYQLLENYVIINTGDSPTLWRDYILVASISGGLLLIILNDRVIYRHLYNYDHDLAVKELIEKIDAGLMDELLVRPLLAKSARN